MTPTGQMRPVRVWDLPTRAFHWLLAASVFAALAVWISRQAA